MVEPYLNQIGGKVDNDVNLFTGGIDTYTDKGFLEANVMPYAMNITMTRPPRISTRMGRQSLATSMESGAWTSSIGKVIELITYNEYLMFAIVEKNNSRKIVKIYKDYNASTTMFSNKYQVADVITIPTAKVYYYTLARQATTDYIYISSESTSGTWFKIKITISSAYVVTAANMADNHYGIVCFHKGRLFLGDPTSNIVTFSALYDFDDFDDNPPDPDYSVIAGDFKITNGIGNLVALKSFDDKLMIFCEHSMHCLYGDTPDITRQNQFQLVDLNNNLGAMAEKCIAIGGGRLFWLGDNNEVYEYTGSAINVVSRPGKTRNSTLSLGGISGLAFTPDVHPGRYIDPGFSQSKFVATSDHLYINAYNYRDQLSLQKLLFVFDIYNRVWWVEDGDFQTIEDFRDNENQILIGLENGDILISSMTSNGYDKLYNFEDSKMEDKDIEYEFHTRVYGADGVDMRKTLSDVWFQARADAEVFIEDRWTSSEDWYGDVTIPSNDLKIGELIFVNQSPEQKTKYRPNTYEQQRCIVPKMYGERLNAFQIIVKGKGQAIFYLMKREWRAR